MEWGGWNPHPRDTFSRGLSSRRRSAGGHPPARAGRGRGRPAAAGRGGAPRMGAVPAEKTLRPSRPSSLLRHSKSTFRQIVRNGIRHSVAQTGSRPGFLEAGTVHSSRWLPIKQVSLHEHRLARPEFKSFARLFKVPREAKLQIGSILGPVSGPILVPFLAPFRSPFWSPCWSQKRPQNGSRK